MNNSDLSQIKDYDPTKVQKDEVFLDNWTGDFYETSQGTWVIAGNFGLHWVNSLGSYADRVKKPLNYNKKI